MYSIYKKNLIKDYNRDKHAKLVFVPFGRSFIVNVLTNLSDK